MAAPPRVSVLMTTRNGAGTIGASVASVLRQNMPAFELVIVDDASTDGTPGLIAAMGDPRVVAVRVERRLGIAGARNHGLALCRAPLVAMLDHDDLSDRRRLGLQLARMDAEPQLVVLGTAVRELRDERLRPEDQPPRLSTAEMRFALHVDNPLAWSSVMVRVSALRALPVPWLDPAREPSDDFDLYHRLLAVGEVGRLDAPLTTYRWHASNATHAAGPVMEAGARAVLARAYAPWLGAAAGEAAGLMVRHGVNRQPIPDRATLVRVREVVLGVRDGLSAQRPESTAAYARAARRVLWRLSRAAVRGGRPDLFAGPAPVLDGAVSVAVGTVRAGLAQLRRLRG